MASPSIPTNSSPTGTTRWKRLTRQKDRAIKAIAAALVAGELALDGTADRDATVEALQALPGIGPWTASYISMRALGDRDAFLATDLGVRIAAERLGLPTNPRALERYAERWRPWRAYAMIYLWESL